MNGHFGRGRGARSSDGGTKLKLFDSIRGADQGLHRWVLEAGKRLPTLGSGGIGGAPVLRGSCIAITKGASGGTTSDSHIRSFRPEQAFVEATANRRIVSLQAFRQGAGACIIADIQSRASIYASPHIRGFPFVSTTVPGNHFSRPESLTGTL